jgi:predicted kinase
VAECVILIGLPGAGKSTFVRQHLAATHDHVSKDAMPNTRDRDRRQAQLIAAALAAGRSVAVDNTNPSAEVRAPILALARQYGADVVGYCFPADVSDALRRNRLRAGRERVPDVAVFTTRRKLVLPHHGEGFDRLFVVTPGDTPHSFVVTPVVR